MVQIHSPRPNPSKNHSHSHYSGRVQTGSSVDPTLTRMLDSIIRCGRVLINLPSDDFADLLGPYQEV